MPYALVDVDVCDPLPGVQLAPRETGVGLVVRRRGRPVGFVLEALPAGSRLSPEQVDRLIGRECAATLVREAVLDELGGRVGWRDAAPAPPRLTVAVCTRDRAESLRRCLDSVAAVLRSPGDVEILVVDNAPSDDRTGALVTGLPGVRYVREPRPGLDFARNRALREATGEVIAYLDDDVEVDHGWLNGLREAWSTHPDAAAVTGQVLPFELRTDAQVTFERNGGFRRGFATVRYEGPVLPGNPLFPFGAGMFGAGCNMSYRRAVVRDLGGFDEALDTGRPLPGGGDLDMFFRVLRSGHPLIYAPAAMVFHKHRREHEALRHQLYTWGTGFMAFATKTFQHDRAGRPAVVRLVRWWFGWQLREVARSVLGRGALAPELAAAQLIGGIVGLGGAYPRSVRRSAEIRRRVR